jgi:hypothetical protein
MTDIVERLRARRLILGDGVEYVVTSSPDPDCAEAADLIEQLRSQLSLQKEKLPRPRGREKPEYVCTMLGTSVRGLYCGDGRTVMGTGPRDPWVCSCGRTTDGTDWRNHPEAP